MANGPHRFKKGNKYRAKNPGRPPLPADLRNVKETLTPDIMKRVVNKYADCNLETLERKARDKKTKVRDLMIISIMIKAIRNGDYKRLAAIGEWGECKPKAQPIEINTNLNLTHLTVHEAVKLGREAVQYLEAEVIEPVEGANDEASADIEEESGDSIRESEEV